MAKRIMTEVQLGEVDPERLKVLALNTADGRGIEDERLLLRSDLLEGRMMRMVAVGASIVRSRAQQCGEAEDRARRPLEGRAGLEEQTLHYVAMPSVLCLILIGRFLGRR